MEIISADLHLDMLPFFVFVHLGNHEAVMQKDVIVVTAGKFAGDVILSSMPVGHLLGSNLDWACEELLRRNPPSVRF